MKNQIRPVFVGVLLGIFSIIFGIFWAMYLATQHESIHRTLSMSARSSIEGKFVVSPEGDHANHSAHNGHDAVADKMTGAEGGAHPMRAMYSDDEMEEAHERLTRGHLHAMGLGLITISVSVLLSFLSASHKMKTLAATCLGTGGFFYPFSWIIMGYRTPALGAEGAAQSVVPIAGLSAILVLIGVFLTLFFLVRDFVKGRL